MDHSGSVPLYGIFWQRKARTEGKEEPLCPGFIPSATDCFIATQSSR